MLRDAARVVSPRPMAVMGSCLAVMGALLNPRAVLPAVLIALVAYASGQKFERRRQRVLQRRQSAALPQTPSYLSRQLAVAMEQSGAVVSQCVKERCGPGQLVAVSRKTQGAQLQADYQVGTILWSGAMQQGLRHGLPLEQAAKVGWLNPNPFENSNRVG